jgi:ribonucleoside-diphosphate reductase alpha chain
MEENMQQFDTTQSKNETKKRVAKTTQTGSGKKKTAKSLKTEPIQGEMLGGSKGSPKTLPFERTFTKAGKNPLEAVRYVKRSSAIKDSDGQVVFEMNDVEVPEGWSQLATDILVHKYFRKAGVPKLGSEKSARHVVYRIANTIATEGLKAGYFDKEASRVFEDELSHLLIHQMGAFNSPVWFNLGLWHQYGIEGSGGNFTWDEQLGDVKETKNAYENPQCSACFIQSVDDDLMSIFELVKNEARLFKYGSGTGTNFSKIRGRQEKLSGGGFSSGLMSFLEVLDRGAGATKSGGTTRRAAKMVCLDMDHPEIEDFITWKAREEKKAHLLIQGGMASDFNGEAYRTVGGQNSNNSIRVSDEFMKAVDQNAEWHLKARTDGSVIKTVQARDLWETVGQSAWSCADPGVQYDTTINDWHTCPNTDRIHASNPCSEYMFLDDTACNLSSLNLVKFMKEDGSFDIEAYKKACRVFIVAQEILVDLSSYPTKQVAKNSHDYRPLGLGYANLGTLLMIKGIPYDSDEAQAWAGALTGIMCGEAYAVSAEEAGQLGAFAGFAKNREPMLRVIAKHRDAAYQIDETKAPKELVVAARKSWDKALKLGTQFGYRNSQVTVLAPTGTIGLLMDCDTTGIEPDFALVKFKKLAGGGYFKIVNQSVPKALQNLGYKQEEIEDILRYILGTMSLEGAPHVNPEFLKSKGLSDADLAKIEKTLPGTFELSSAFTKWGFGEETFKRLGISAEEFNEPGFNFLRWAGLSEAQIEEANEVICGTMTVEGAPKLKEEHLPVFDCANKCGQKGKRFIAPMGHIRMMGAAQPFLSGAISKTVNVPGETSVQEIEDIYYQGWKLGLKAVALYRDGSKQSQPLSTKSDKSSSKKKGDEKLAEEEKEIAEQEKFASMIKAGAQMTFAPVRRKLPERRSGFTQEAVIAGHKVFVRTGEYEDGTLGEVFIDMHKEGAAYRSMMNCFAISISLGLQYGVPLEEFVDKFTFTRFEPAGMVTGHPNIKVATSIVDFIFRILGMEYLGRTDFLQVKPAMDISGEKRGDEVSEKAPKSPSQMMKSGIPMAGTDLQMNMSLDEQRKEKAAATAARSGKAPENNYLSEMMGDAPPCDSCGHTTVRNGSCYRCMNCGNSMGCS